MAKYIQPAFSGGEISPSLYGRVDTDMYRLALRKAENLIIHPSGGVSNRPGLQFVGPVKDHTYAPRLIEFEFNAADKYLLEFGDQYMRVIRAGAYVTETAKNITGATQANPVVITSTAHGFANNDQVYIENVAGMTQLNGRFFTVANVTANTFELKNQLTGANVDGTGYGAYTSGGTAARLYQIATAYNRVDLPELKYTQSADVMTLTHPLYPVYELSRTAHTNWVLSKPIFGPDQAAPTISVGIGSGSDASFIVTAINQETGEESLPAAGVASLGSGSSFSFTISNITKANPAVVTISSPAVSTYLQDGDIVRISGISGMPEVNNADFEITGVTASTFQLKGEDSTNYAAYTGGGTAKPTFARGAGGTAVTLTWNTTPGAGSYTVYWLKDGQWGWVGDTTFLTKTFNTSTPSNDPWLSRYNSSIKPPRFRNPFRSVGNFPGTVSFYEQRRVFGGTTLDPDTSFYSVIGGYSSMQVSSPVQDDDAITAALAATQVHEIRHYVPRNKLLIFTFGGEWTADSGPDAGFSAATIKQKMQSNWGSSHLRPLLFGDKVIFSTRRQSNVRSFGYSLDVDGYNGSDLNAAADHIWEFFTLEDWAANYAPDFQIHTVRSDGASPVLTLAEGSDAAAWSRWVTDGKFEAVASGSQSAEAPEDEIYYVVKRTIGGVTARYIERTHTRRFSNLKDAFFVDCGLSLDSPKTITGATAANPVVITSTAHGFANGDEVDIDDIVWVANEDALSNRTQPAQLNGNRYTVANVTANTFELSGVDGSAYNAYVEGGKVRKAVTAITGLWHLEGRAVSVLADGVVRTGHTVVNGGITLATKASRVHVGLKYVSDLETLDIENRQQTLQGETKTVSRVMARLRYTAGGLIGPDNLNLVSTGISGMLSGDVEVVIPQAYNTNGRILIRQAEPLPMTVLAVVPEFFTE